jgi:hypothetical protein
VNDARSPAKVILHFGMPKTGSSSIQASLYAGLRDARFSYLHFGRANANREVIIGFADDPNRYGLIRRLALSEEALEQTRLDVRRRMLEQIEQAAGKTVILSCEALYGLKLPELRALVALLRGAAGHVSAVGYLRRPKDFMESSFQQRLKALETKSFEPALDMPNYRGRLEKFDKVLGCSKVQYWLFDRNRFPAGCVVQDFCARVGIRFDADAVVHQNESFSLAAVSLLYVYGKFGAGYGTGVEAVAENRLLHSKLRELTGPRLRFHSDVVEPFLARRRATIEWAEARAGASLGDSAAPDDALAVRSEQDLLRVPPEAVDWLKQQLGGDAGDLQPSSAPEQIASAMHRLRLKVGRSA